jgi:hypothetical protein
LFNMAGVTTKRISADTWLGREQLTGKTQHGDSRSFVCTLSGCQELCSPGPLV